MEENNFRHREYLLMKVNLVSFTINRLLHRKQIFFYRITSMLYTEIYIRVLK